MRKVYVLGEEEFDEMFDSEQYDESDGCIENPTCPRCGRELLLAYTDGDEFQVITWHCLLDEDWEAAETWYFVCGNFTCAYEEEIEMVKKPAGATLYDCSDASMTFGCETGFDDLNAAGQRELMEQLKELHAAQPNRKLPSMIADLQWYYDQHVEQMREWLARVPQGRKVSVHYGGEEYAGYLATYSETSLTLRLADSGEHLAFRLDEVCSYGPQYFRDEPEEPPEPPERQHLIMMVSSERCVVRGHHLHLDHVDRFGRHHARTWDEATGKALGMKHLGGTCYGGVFRRGDVEGRYHLRRLLKVAGQWVEWLGPTEKDDVTAVKTEDPEVAQALGFKPWKPWFPNEDGTWPPPPFFYGFVSDDQVEEREEHPVWYWPFPEAKGVDR